MTFKGAVLATALAVSLTACATATPYQPNVPGQQTSGGFSERRLEQDRFQVSFAGNTLTSRETVERYLLYRAAEVTVQQGYDWFETADRRTERSARTTIESDPFMRPGFGYGGYGYWRPSWRYMGARYGGWRSWDPFGADPFFANQATVRTVQKFEATAEIVLHRGSKPSGERNAYDAREIMSALGPDLQRPA